MLEIWKEGNLSLLLECIKVVTWGVLDIQMCIITSPTEWTALKVGVC